MMKQSIFILIVLLFGIGTLAVGQTTRDVAAPKPPPPQYQAVKKNKKQFFLFRIFQKKQQTDADEVAAFREKIKRNARKRSKELRKADKPQYNDPLYFGHKKPPKKRKNGKKKFCKTCGLVH